jgi:hypothetical protein
MRFILGGADDEMTAISSLIRVAIAAGLKAEIVEAAPGPRSEAQYASTVEPQAGDVWIECAPLPATCPPCAGRGEDAAGYQSGHCPYCGGHGALAGRELLDALGIQRIDHHQPGDPGYGVEGFAGSSLGQLLRLLLERGVSPQALGLHLVDDPTTYSFPEGWCDAGGPYGYGWGVWRDGSDRFNIHDFLWFRVPPQWEATGLADHDPVGFAGGHHGRWSRKAAREFLIARAVAGGRGFSEADVAEALRLIEAAPTLPGFPAVYDLRTIPELLPATSGADRKPIPGTGGRLGDAAFVAVLCLPGKAALNWGAQGMRPAGRHIGLIGDTAALPVTDVLASIPGIQGVYGAPGKACGGYVQVQAPSTAQLCGVCNGPIYATAGGPECGCGLGLY